MIYFELFYTFFAIGLFTFGGGYAMLPLIQERVVANGWMEVSQIMDFIAVSESTPGPFAINIATYVGTQMGGVFGAVCATLGVVLPSFIVILIVARCYEKFKSSRLVAGAMTGLRPVVIGLIGSAVLSMALEVFFSAGFSLAVLTGYWFIVSLIIAAVAMVLMFAVKLHPVLLILISAALGIGAGYLEPLIMK
ncbi:MAG: chromate transporter [Ruminococcaceae bacterium]|nr:chromate transporter [Oscillospiraceae bacterium]